MSGGWHSKSMQETEKKRRRKIGGEGEGGHPAHIHPPARMHASPSIRPNIPPSTPAPEPECEIQNETRIKGKEGRQQRSACRAIHPPKRKRQARSGEAWVYAAIQRTTQHPMVLRHATRRKKEMKEDEGRQHPDMWSAERSAHTPTIPQRRRKSDGMNEARDRPLVYPMEISHPTKTWLTLDGSVRSLARLIENFDEIERQDVAPVSPPLCFRPCESTEGVVWRGTRKGGGGGAVDVLLHLGDVLKGPEGEMVLQRILVGGNPKIAYFGLKWTILDGVMPRLGVACELKCNTSFAAAMGGRKRLDGRKARVRVVVEGKGQGV
ncbi:hypothetical protein B0H14DRAFT_3657653 [Mycena olivaceomarginata]|nr:hypothetical protein B0H14DRAFT_3657653 [Mycena olivaceomarginata]